MNGTINATLAANSTLPEGSCTLSPRARALSSILTAFIPVIIGGISGGFDVAFFTAWASWLGVLRVLLVGVYQVVCVLCSKPIAGDDDFYNFIPFGSGNIRAFNHPFFREGAVSTSPTFFGWLTWLYSTCYAPVIQVMWLVENWNKADAELKVARAIGVVVVALPSTIDTKARYGKALGERYGPVFEVVFTFMTAASTMLLGVVAATEHILAAIDGVSWRSILVYIVFALYWTYLGFLMKSPHDEVIAVNSASKLLAGLAMGAISGCFAAAPAFVVVHTASNKPGIGLNGYLHCRNVELWQKVVAFLP